MGRLFDWVFRTIVFYFKAAIFLGVLLLLSIFGTIRAAIYGGSIMPDDVWFLAKIVFLLLLPLALAIALKSWAALPLGAVASILLACSFSWGTYTHASGFREAKLYSVENGKLVVPEENRELLLRGCGHEGLRDSCRTIIYCQEPAWDASGRSGCEELLMKKTSPALLDLALQERRDFEYDQR
ncbi:MAG: hypothetical protein LAP21_25665 [Acidobacteriia bacterium]|nr:hypothetical protein [Terriglobia bacterium]